MRIENEILLDFDDVLIRPKRSTLSSRKDVSLERSYRFRNGIRWTGIPIIAANMDGIGTKIVSSVLRTHSMMTCYSKYEEFDESSNVHPLFDILSFGWNDFDWDKTVQIIDDHGFRFLCVDVANGYSSKMADFVEALRYEFPSHIIIAGNVATGEMTQELLLRGADIVKIGIGPGSVCTTRTITGVGYPQLSAIIECADAAHGLNGHIIADGGCRTPGDVVKAFGAGADFVMLGGMLAGHDETTTSFHGMSSREAMELRGSVPSYRASEGISVHLPSRGPLENTLQEILGGLRSACTYVGAVNLKQLSKCTTFVRVNRQRNTVFNEYQTSY